MAGAVSPRDTVPQYPQVARATPALAPSTQFRRRHRRLALALTPRRPRHMRCARHFARNGVRNGRTCRHHAAARRRRRRRHRGHGRALHELGGYAMTAGGGECGGHFAGAWTDDTPVGRGYGARVRERLVQAAAAQRERARVLRGGIGDGR